MSQVFFAREEAQKGAPLQSTVVPDGPAEHRIAGLKRIEHRALRYRRSNVQLYFTPDVRQIAEMSWKYHSDHGKGFLSDKNR